MTTITFRTDEKLKKDLQESAKNLGLSLNQLINLKMREFNQNKVLHLDMNEKVEVEDFSDKEIQNMEKYGNFTNLNTEFNSLLKEKGIL